VTVSRKLVLLAGVLLVLAGCTSGVEQLRLRIATGFETGVYNALGNALADEWAMQTGMPRAEVLLTQGSPDNLARLVNGQADIAFIAADVAIDAPPDVSALARIYDDYLHIVVRAESSIQSVPDLAGRRISVGAPNSGVKKIAERILQVAGVAGQQRELTLQQSAEALREDEIDAFFWSGGLPTKEIKQLAENTPVRLLDMSDQMPAIRQKYDSYSAAAIPLSTYQGMKNTNPVTTLVVPNLLLTTDQLPAEAVRALTDGIFEAQPKLANKITAAYSIDIRSAIETRPIPLHPGALAFYRDRKG
jgi:uncharacterized protein